MRSSDLSLNASSQSLPPCLLAQEAALKIAYARIILNLLAQGVTIETGHVVMPLLADPKVEVISF